MQQWWVLHRTSMCVMVTRIVFIVKMNQKSSFVPFVTAFNRLKVTAWHKSRHAHCVHTIFCDTNTCNFFSESTDMLWKGVAWAIAVCSCLLERSWQTFQSCLRVRYYLFICLIYPIHNKMQILVKLDNTNTVQPVTSNLKSGNYNQFSIGKTHK